MLLGHLDYLELNPFLPAKLHHAIQFVKNTFTTETKPDLYEIEGKHIFAILSDNVTENAADRKAEFHAKHIDIQILLSGEEGYEICTKPYLTAPDENYLKEKDLAFINKMNDSKMIVLHANEFIVFYPSEIHKPLCQTNGKAENIRKVVIKIDKDYV